VYILSEIFIEEATPCCFTLLYPLRQKNGRKIIELIQFLLKLLTY